MAMRRCCVALAELVEVIRERVMDDYRRVNGREFVLVYSKNLLKYK